MTSNEGDVGDSCCFCYSKNEELVSLVQQHDFNGQMGTYSNMIMECYGIEMKINVQDVCKELLSMCKICTTHLKDAYQFRHQVQNAYKRIEGYAYEFSPTILKFLDTAATGEISDRYSSDDDTDVVSPSPVIKQEPICLNENDYNHISKENIETKSSEENLINDKQNRDNLKIEEKQRKAKKMFLPNKYNLMCRMCNLTFTGAPALKQHMAVHFPNFKCENCDKHVNYENFYRHSLTHQKFVCEGCNVVFNGFNRFQKHLSRESICNIKNKSNSKIIFNKVHRKSDQSEELDTKDKSLSLEPLSNICKVKSLIRKRKRNEDESEDTKCIKLIHVKKLKVKNTKRKTVPQFELDENDLTCKICNKTFAWNRTLKQHMAIHFPNYICHICSKPFVMWTNLRNHLRAHEIVKKIINCTICNKSIRGEDLLKQHMKRHDKHILLYACPRCPERFSTFIQRTNHFINVHNDVTKILKCEFCNKGFKTNTRLRNHVRCVHLKVKNFACEICSSMFFSKNELKSHMYCHTEKKDFQCNVCKKFYARKKTLTEHMKIHNNVKNFVCAICDRAFTQKCSLKGHMKTHAKTEEKPSDGNNFATS